VPAGVSVLTVETSAAASSGILATGREFLPVGGFSGRVPSPTLRAFVADVRAGKVADVLVTASPMTRNPDIEWVIAHCTVHARGATALGGNRSTRLYRCSPADATAGPRGGP
jgi:hypothetical protein